MSVDRPAWMSAAEHDATACRLPTTTGDPGRVGAGGPGAPRPLPAARRGAVIRPSFYTLLTLLSSQTRALQPPTVRSSLSCPPRRARFSRPLSSLRCGVPWLDTSVRVVLSAGWERLVSG
jgi:hypothetical protein